MVLLNKIGSWQHYSTVVDCACPNCVAVVDTITHPWTWLFDGTMKDKYVYSLQAANVIHIKNVIVRILNEYMGTVK